jgi:hypothetical protein
MMLVNVTGLQMVRVVAQGIVLLELLAAGRREAGILGNLRAIEQPHAIELGARAGRRRGARERT